MSLERIWERYRVSGYTELAAASPDDALDCFYLALLAFGHQAYESALVHADRAVARAPDNLVYQQAVTYLQRVVGGGTHHVYASGEGFAAFIRGGGNIPLYRATSAALRHIYGQYHALDVLDVGVGDGHALVPALTDNVRNLDLLEPSRSLLVEASATLSERCVPHRATCKTLQAFATEPADSWDIVQATYSLQSIPPEERLGLFRWLREHAQRLLIAEFDVPRFTAQSAPDQVRYVVERYQQGLVEYGNDRDTVAQEFLIPMMFGYFDSTASRTSFEHPLKEWIAQLQTAGFGAVETRFLYPYWWAPAYLLNAQSAA